MILGKKVLLELMKADTLDSAHQLRGVLQRD
jgi:hypothetical protein